ncbi:unnamed protein product [Arabis nemorensis]|uniref:F-box associated beta-propeller type 3 domain-containing protein n=1 Tax=Arabis nemorensis TaxID=586526 RepID=A0A565CVX9_9BRAS|nr:unnamed protein product [Arabis nemorensis]
MGMSLALALFSSLRWKKKRSPKSTRRVRGIKRLRRGDDLVAPEIPFELQIFSNLHRTVTPPTRSPCLYMSLVEHFDCDSMEVCHNPGKSVLISLSSSSSNGSLSFDPDLTMPGIGGHDMFALRGLILYKVCRKACIYNPTTRQSLTLPAVESNIFAREEPGKYVNYFLGHDPVLDQYKVVCIVVICSEDFELFTSEHWVFVL